MSVPRRFNKPQNLSRIDVLIEDDAVISRFFNITELPEVLTQGKSSFLIGGSALLRNDTEVKFEIVNDDSGAVIYTEPVANYLEGTSRRVSIEIYDDNELFGDCTLTVVGELNPLLTPVPPEFRDSYNVRYTRKVYVSGAGVNTQPILFYNQPRIHVTEIVKPYITTSIPTGSITSTGTLNGSPILEDVGTTTNTKTEEQPAKFLKRKKKSLRSKLFGGGGNNSFIRKGRRRVRRSSPEADRYTMERLSGVNFDSRMVDAKLRIISASVASSFTLQSYHQVPDLYETDIEDVKNSNTIVPDKPFTITDTRFNATDPQREVIVPIESANFTVEFTPIPTQSLSTVNFRSYGDIRISRLRTFSGDIDRIKVYARNNDAFGDFELVSDQQIESPELLFNVFGAGNQSLGFFLEQDTIDNYWIKSSNSTATLTSDTMLNAVALSGSNSGVNDKLTFALDGTYEMTFNDETEYEISFRAIGRKGPKKNVGGNTKQMGRLGVFLSGSAFTTNHNLGDELGFQLETVSGTPAFIEVDAGATEDFDLITEGFQPTFDGKGVVNFVVFGGNFEIADVSIKPASATGFSPNFVQVIAPVPELTSERPDDYEFLAEFYDVNSNVAETITFASASSFAGGNNYIAGGDNLLSGSVFVGSAIGGGIEMAGVSSGLIRSIGYDGFVSASEYPYSGSPGFMFFSGSVFPDSGDNYKGVGLELFGSTGSFFRYRSDPATLEIVTKQFFVGTSGSGEPEQYISGSMGNVEISSSDFHLTPDGNVTASSIILGNKSDGQFLQFVNDQLTVQGNLSIDQITTPALIGGVSSTVLNASSSITADGFAKFNSASIAGFNITPAQISDSDSNLVLKSSGQITGSKVLLDGGKIGGFSLTSNEITATDFILNPSQKLLSLGSGDNIFIADADEGIQLGNATFASAPFSVTRGGVMKASAGTVAGWTMTDSTLEGGDLILEKTGTIRSRGYQSDVAGSGFILTAASGGFLEVENAKIRGTLSTAVFEKESVNAVGGQLYVANSTTLTSSVLVPEGNHSAAIATMSVENASGFVQGEIVSAKKVSDTGFQTEYMLVNSSSRASTDDNDLSGFLMVTRGYGGGTTGDSGSLGDIPSAAQSYSGSQVLVSTGRVGTGYIRINANPSDQATPYIDIVERTGTGLYDVELKARLGDLSGVAGSRNVPLGFTGFGLMSEVAFLSGSNIKLEAPAFLLGDKHQSFVSGSNSNIEISASGFHLQRDGSMQLGSTASGITLNSSGTATFNGSITIQTSDVEAALPDNLVSGSDQIAGVTGSLSASAAAAQAATLLDSGSMASAISLTSTGVNILNSDAEVIAEYGADAIIGRTSGTNSNVKIDSDGNVDIRRGTEVSASFGTTTTIGSTIGNHVKITTKAIEVKTSNTVTALSASAAGLEMSGRVKANSGLIGGFTIDDDEIKNGTDIGMNSAAKAFTINNTTFGNTGIQLDFNSGDPRAFIGKVNGGFLKFDNSSIGVEVSSSNFNLTAEGNIEVGSGEVGHSTREENIVDQPAHDGDITGQYHQYKMIGTPGASAAGNNKVTDDGSGNASLDVVGGATFDSDGIIGTSMHFDGTGFGHEANFAFNPTNSETFTFWLKAEDVQGNFCDVSGDNSSDAANHLKSPLGPLRTTSGGNQIIFVVSDDAEHFMGRISGSHFIFTYHDGDPPGTELQFAKTTAALENDRWYHFVVVFNEAGSGADRIYINGEEDSNFTGQSAHLGAMSGNDFGLAAGHGNYYMIYDAAGTDYLEFNDLTTYARFPFKGKIDDFRLYGNAFSETQAKQLYSSYFTQKTKRTIQYNDSNQLLDLNTKNFFLGSGGHIASSASFSTPSFLSGSNGNLEIFSGNFHLKPTGDVSIRGNVRATSGEIGGFTLSAGKLTGDNTGTALLATSKIGKRVEIDGSDNSLKFFVPSASIDKEVITLSDQGSIYSMIPAFIAPYTSSALVFQEKGGIIIKTPPAPYNTAGSSISNNAMFGVTMTRPRSDNTALAGHIWCGNNIGPESIDAFSNGFNNGAQTYAHYISLKEKGTGGVYVMDADIELGDVDDFDGINLGVTTISGETNGHFFGMDMNLAIDQGNASSYHRYGIRVTLSGTADQDSRPLHIDDNTNLNTGNADENAYGISIDQDGVTKGASSTIYGIIAEGADENLIEGKIDLAGGSATAFLPYADNLIDLGASSKRWDDVRATNGTINTSDRDLKTQISGSDLGLNFINTLNPVKYQWISGSRTHYGLIAQEVSQSLKDLSIGVDNFAGYTLADNYKKEVKIYRRTDEDEFTEKRTEKEILADDSLKIGTGSFEFEHITTKEYSEEKSKIEKDTSKHGDLSEWTYVNSQHGLRYNEFIAPLIKSVQELTQAHNNLIAQITGSTDLNQLKAAVTASLI